MAPLIGSLQFIKSRRRVWLLVGVTVVAGLAIGYVARASRAPGERVQTGGQQVGPDGRVHRVAQDRSNFTTVREGRVPPMNVNPEHVPARDAPVEDWEIVLGTVINGEAVAYPVNYMAGAENEIVNDTVAGRPIAASW